MAEYTAAIKPKKSSTASEVPSAGDLQVGELAVNTADGKLFVKHTDDSIKEISGGGGGLTPEVPTTGYGEYVFSTSGTATPSAGVATVYSQPNNWAVNVVDNLGNDFETSLYATSTT